MHAGISDGTRAGYERHQRSFFAWCASAGRPPRLPVDGSALCNWIAWLADKPVRPGTIRGHLSGLRSLHTDLNLDSDAFDLPQVERVFRGVRRTLGAADRRRRMPITLPILVRLLSALKSLPVSAHDQSCLAAAWAVAYVGGMRCGELTYDTFDSAFHMSRDSFKDFGSYATILLPASKTDPFRKGVLVVVPAAPQGSPVDPLALLRAFIATTRPGAPLFFRLDSWSLSRGLAPNYSFPRSFFVDSLRRCLTASGLPAHEYAGHSFRRGLATWAKLAAKLEDGDIKLLGRWSSDAVKLYQQTSDSDIASLARSTLTVPARSIQGVPPPARCWWGDECD